MSRRDPNLPMDPDTGKIYHLDCNRDELADRILLVGDPGRVPVVSKLFDIGSITFDNTHREIRIITGAYKGVPVSVLSTGMGTDNIEICVNEIHALKERDYHTGQWAPLPAGRQVVMIRVGTCGSPQLDAEVGMLAITDHTIGLDNTCAYYVRPDAVSAAHPSIARLEALLRAGPESLGAVVGGVYAARADPSVVRAIEGAAAAHCPARKRLTGITASSSGFYACQGRPVGRFVRKAPDLVEKLASIKLDLAPEESVSTAATTEVVSNIEMECSALTFLAGALGYKAGAVCAVVAKRNGSDAAFAESISDSIADAIRVGMDALVAVPV
jgi:uridine phosphorylase